MAAVTICSDLGAQKIKVCHCFHCFPIYFPWSDAMILVFWILSLKPTFSLSSFTFIKRLFSSLLSAVSVVSSAYLRLLKFLPAILIQACVSSSPVFLMMYSAYKLNKQDYNIQPCLTPFPILNQSIVPCKFLTVVSWPAYRFLRRQVRWLYSYLCKNFPVSWDSQSQRLLHSQWSRSICFVEFPWFCFDTTDAGNLISGSSAFSKSILFVYL